MKRLVYVVSLSLLLSTSSAAEAAEPTVAQCIAHFESVLPLRKTRKLRDARQELAECAVPACPRDVRLECEKQIEVIKAAIPTIVFETKDRRGQDLADVVVTADGKPFATKLDGTALEADPGAHVFTFSVEGAPTVTQSWVLREGEKGRRESIVLGPPTPAPPTPEANEPKSEQLTRDGAQPRIEWGASRVTSVVLTGAGLVGVGVGSGFGVVAISKSSAQKSACSGHDCGSSAYQTALNDHATAASSATVATVSLIGGGVAIAAGAVLWFTAPKSPADEKPGVSFLPWVGPSIAGLSARGVF